MGKRHSRRKSRKRKSKKAQNGPSYKDLLAEVKYVRAERGELGRRIGKATEQRVVKSFIGEFPDVPRWLFNVRAGTKKQDCAGIDIVATTDVGDLPLQVKSSESEKKKFINFHGKNIPVIVVSISDSDRQIRNSVVSLMKKKRKTVL